MRGGNNGYRGGGGGGVHMPNMQMQMRGAAAAAARGAVHPMMMRGEKRWSQGVWPSTKFLKVPRF